MEESRPELKGRAEENTQEVDHMLNSGTGFSKASGDEF